MIWKPGLTRSDVTKIRKKKIGENMKKVMIDGKEFQEVQVIGDIVLVRTYSAGVHFGVLASRDGKEVVLKNARCLWSWQGACSLYQVAMDGVDMAKSKITVSVPHIELTEAIEVIPMSKAAGEQMMGAESWKR